MKYAQINSPFNYTVQFQLNGEPVSPSSATITIVDNTGSDTSVDGVSLTIPTAATSVIFTIPADVNETTVPNALRYVQIAFVYLGQTHYISDVYLLRASLLMPITKDDVRRLTTMTSSELPDENIDLFAAYNELNSDLGGVLPTLIADGSEFVPQIQLALAAKAAVNSCLLLELMLMQSEQSDNTIYKRFSKIDFEAMLARLRGLYDTNLILISEVTVAVPTIFIAAVGTDPITGA